MVCWDKMFGSCTGETLEINSHSGENSASSNGDAEATIITSTEATMLNNDRNSNHDLSKKAATVSLCVRPKRSPSIITPQRLATCFCNASNCSVATCTIRNLFYLFPNLHFLLHCVPRCHEALPSAAGKSFVRLELQLMALGLRRLQLAFTCTAATNTHGR